MSDDQEYRDALDLVMSRVPRESMAALTAAHDEKPLRVNRKGGEKDTEFVKRITMAMLGRCRATARPRKSS